MQQALGIRAANHATIIFIDQRIFEPLAALIHTLVRVIDREHHTPHAHLADCVQQGPVLNWPLVVR